MKAFVSAAKAERVEVVSEELTNEEIQLGIKRLARIRANLRSIRLEISDKILDGLKDCIDATSSTMHAVGELNATTNGKTK